MLGGKFWELYICPEVFAFLHHTAWNADVTAGTLATILDHEDKSHGMMGLGSRGLGPEGFMQH